MTQDVARLLRKVASHHNILPEGKEHFACLVVFKENFDPEQQFSLTKASIEGNMEHLVRKNIDDTPHLVSGQASFTQDAFYRLMDNRAWVTLHNNIVCDIEETQKRDYTLDHLGLGQSIDELATGFERLDLAVPLTHVFVSVFHWDADTFEQARHHTFSLKEALHLAMSGAALHD